MGRSGGMRGCSQRTLVKDLFGKRDLRIRTSDRHSFGGSSTRCRDGSLRVGPRLVNDTIVYNKNLINELSIIHPDP